MKNATSLIIYCFLMFLLMNNVKGQGKKKPPCPLGLSANGKCGHDGPKLCFSEMERKFNKDVVKTITHCKCWDDRRNNVDKHRCTCYLKHGFPCTNG
ncbi:SCR-like 20 [Arabidopsis thaliana]|uniref:Putative defensin-like protein 236 n=2 Tax=Arabidopsis thaliana TaxID=3702 RepID=DF236_ARATH|nr:SCR-like 20 [Arabidopsis thaliana]P82639.1 RecName: Full=Putative defensin-like protein 236; AltName: Full=Putative S locus cysteine-rich-like protein 20; Short=Protein SCRL20; Short=SCR-like protein 20; Flags: Precursor [Arabidopsis thaliana]AEE82843.1 SCR-like 20 [Arabidopsis thaliana]CAA0394426.1 unnamed protein product [Arabidopsis thaliana]|eukprot:NP_001031608.1 SCR-like 20 [Arabidopsis thaliana]